VPVTVLRDKQRQTLNVTIGEIDLEQENGQRADADPSAQGASTGFGMTLGGLTADRARRLGVPSGTSGAVITDVDQAGAAARAGLRPGDVILQVNRQAVASASEASKLLQEVRSGGTALVLVWRQNQELFIPVRKD
jgi:serine protease Do